MGSWRSNVRNSIQLYLVSERPPHGDLWPGLTVAYARRNLANLRLCFGARNKQDSILDFEYLLWLFIISPLRGIFTFN